MHKLLPIAFLLLASCHESFEARLTNQAKNQTRMNCPKRVDKFTILDSITYSADTNDWCYHYTLTDSLDNAALYTTQTKTAFHDILLQKVRNNLELRSIKEHGISISYTYHLKSDGKAVINETFTRDDY